MVGACRFAGAWLCSVELGATQPCKSLAFLLRADGSWCSWKGHLLLASRKAWLCSGEVERQWGAALRSCRIYEKSSDPNTRPGSERVLGLAKYCSSKKCSPPLRGRRGSLVAEGEPLGSVFGSSGPDFGL